MKKRSIQLFTALLFITITGASSSCKKKNESGTGTFYFHLHSNIDTNEVADNTTLYTDENGRRFGLSAAQILISAIELKNANGSTCKIADAYVMTGIDNEEYLIGTAPAGTYTSITFSVGLDAATNATLPSSHTAGSVLSSADSWFGTTTGGYMFARIEGFADTTALHSGTSLQHFTYHIGSAANLKTVTMPTRGAGSYTSFAPWVLATGATQYVHMVCDYGKMLSGVDFKTQFSTDTYTLNPSLANTIAGNFANSFRYEE